MATIIYKTDNFLNNLQPDSGVPAGMLLCNAVKYTVPSATLLHSSPDRLYLMSLPKDAILTDVKVAVSDCGSSAAFDLGLAYKNYETVSSVEKVPGDEIDFNGIFAAAPIATGPTAMSFYHYINHGDATLATEAHANKYIGALGKNYKLLYDSILVFTPSGAATDASATIEVCVLYFMDYGQDLST